MVKANIAVLRGDGIGPEVVEQAEGVLRAVAKRFGNDIRLLSSPFGGRSLDRHGSAFPELTSMLCRGYDATLLGAVGGPQWEKLPAGSRPEAGVIALRDAMGL